ncbi:MAG: hypothetical protein J6A59_10340 [Lachnospiraceae bacterium]|nr:hypothetical protein [Lachnospiraceae bacterium]
MDFVAVDLGASGSRYVTDCGQISVLSNNMVVLPNNELSSITPDATDIESCLEVQIVKETGAECNHFPANVLIGIMADRLGGALLRPNSMAAKHQQKVNYISTIVSCALARLKYGVEEAFDLYLAVPPIQIEDAREVFGKSLVGTYLVKFPKYMGGTEVRLTINDSISISEEAFMAITSFFFNMNGTVKESAKQYMSGNVTVLSLDIGASTSDISIIRNGRYLNKSGMTYQYGGNIARSALIDAIRRKYTIELPVEDAERVMAEGRLQLGNKYVDISEEVSSAKRALAKQLAVCMQDYFGKIQIPPTSINAIIVSGGGSLQGQYISEDGEVVNTSEPMSFFVTEEYRQWSQYTDVVPYGDEARFANIKGLYIKAKMDQVKRNKEQLMSQAAQPIVQPVAQSVAQPVVQSVQPQPVVQSTVQAVQPQPVVQTNVQPVVQPAPQVSAEQPAAQTIQTQ